MEIGFALYPSFQPIFTCSKSANENTRTICEISSQLIDTMTSLILIDVVPMSLFLTLNRFCTLFWCLHCYFEHDLHIHAQHNIYVYIYVYCIYNIYTTYYIISYYILYIYTYLYITYMYVYI